MRRLGFLAAVIAMTACAGDARQTVGPPDVTLPPPDSIPTSTGPDTTNTTPNPRIVPYTASSGASTVSVTFSSQGRSRTFSTTTWAHDTLVVKLDSLDDYYGRAFVTLQAKVIRPTDGHGIVYYEGYPVAWTIADPDGKDPRGYSPPGVFENEGLLTAQDSSNIDNQDLAPNQVQVTTHNDVGAPEFSYYIVKAVVLYPSNLAPVDSAIFKITK
jgi:hypothetical protein